jgi:exopolysaccharide biosynthesis protein
MVGIDADGWLIVAAIRGFSNRVGVSVQGAAETMKMLGAQSALMIDNGGDVMMWFEDEMILQSSEGRRDRLRSILLYRTTKQPSEMGPFDLRLVSYPKQYGIDLTRSEHQF